MRVLAINQFPFFSQLARCFASRRDCFTRRLFSNYSEGGCAAASVSRRWKNRWGETEGPGEEGAGVSSCWHPSSDVGCRTASVGGGASLDRCWSLRCQSTHKGREGGEGVGGMGVQALAFLHSGSKCSAPHAPNNGWRRKKSQRQNDTMGRIAAGSDLKVWRSGKFSLRAFSDANMSLYPVRELSRHDNTAFLCHLLSAPL